MKSLLTLLLLVVAIPASAGVPSWSNVPSTGTGTSTTYLAGTMKVYVSTKSAAAVPAVVIDGPSTRIVVGSGLNVTTMSATGFYGNGSGLTNATNAAYAAALSTAAYQNGNHSFASLGVGTMSVTGNAFSVGGGTLNVQSGTVNIGLASSGLRDLNIYSGGGDVHGIANFGGGSIYGMDVGYKVGTGYGLIEAVGGTQGDAYDIVAIQASGGKVGIGTSSPGNTLTVVPSSYGKGLSIRRPGNTYDALRVGINSSEGTEFTTTNAPIDFLTYWDVALATATSVMKLSEVGAVTVPRGNFSVGGGTFAVLGGSVTINTTATTGKFAWDTASTGNLPANLTVGTLGKGGSFTVYTPGFADAYTAGLNISGSILTNNASINIGAYSTPAAGHGSVMNLLTTNGTTASVGLSIDRNLTVSISTSVVVAYGSLGVGVNAAVLNAYATKFYVENDIADDYAGIFNNPKAAGNSDGVKIIAGGNSTDTAFLVQDRTETSNFLKVAGDGRTTILGSLGVTGGIDAASVNLSTVTTALAAKVSTSGGTMTGSLCVDYSGGAGAYYCINSQGFAQAGTGSMDISNIATQPIIFKTQGTERVRVSATGGLRPYSRTMAQLLAITPAEEGETYYCNNCSPKKVVVSTGTAAGNFAAADGGTFQ